MGTVYPPFFICSYSPWRLWEVDHLHSPLSLDSIMANNENFKLTSALRNATQKIHHPNFPSFDKDTPLTLALKTP